MKTLIAALLIAFGVGVFAAPHASASPAAPAAIADALAGDASVQHVWYDSRGRWHPSRRVYRPPVYVVPRCRTVRVCDRLGRCWWQRRCY
jgi:hypothetical protein